MALIGKRALLIEDDPDVRVLIKKILESAGLKVSEATSVEQGLAIALDLAPHIIITDLNLPEQSGFTFLEKRRENVSIKNVPVLVCSGLSDMKSINKAISLGAADYLLKPISAQIILQKVRKSLYNNAFRKILFEPKARPKVSVTVSGQIVMANETGFLLQAPARLSLDTPVKVASLFLDQLDLTNAPLKTAGRPGRFAESGQYLNDVMIVGITERAATAIRRTVRGWK